MAQQLSEIEKATNIYGDIAKGYESMPRTVSTVDPQGAQLQIGKTYDQGTYWGSTPTQVRSQSGGGGGAGGYVQPQVRDDRISRPTRTPSAPISMGYMGPTMDKPTLEQAKLKGPGKLKYDEYKPPERDPREEKALRQEYMAPGMSQVRKSTQQAIISSKSFDNPNARANFINKALEGVGSAVSNIAGTAGRAAGKEARMRYQDEVTKYHTGYQVGMEEAKTNWDAAWQVAMTKFQSQTSANLANYQAAMQTYGQMPLPQQIEGQQ